MGIFNFMETSFFISLGIIFILIFLIVYHFKERMISMEEKSNTLFEIINNIVKELTVIKQTVSQKEAATHIPIHQIPISPFHADLGGSVCYSTENYLEKDETQEDSTHIIIYDDENDYRNDYDEGEHEGDEEGDEAIEDEDEDENDDVDEANDDKEEKEPIIKSDKEKEKEALLKIIKLELSKSELEESEHQEEGEGEHPDESLINDKSNEENPLEETSNPMHNDRDYYRKLNIQQLKTIVSSKGLSTDVQKLKKNDLIKILENTTNS